ncbi:DUF4238 domain-containing protein [Mucilaginibacter sp. RCC_168]|uniref:DUF4238 domain-containing protein n=1 Tax=Mucilaginibacter sp. RCC_168 TaxID=3239221 RepID=UPI003525FE60
MANPQKTKAQHFVPRSYLKQFVNDKHLYVLNLETLRKGWKEFPRKQTPAGICYAEDYYTIREDHQNHYFGLGGRDSHFVEDQVLKSLEDHYPVLLQKITTKMQINMADAIAMSDFITTVNLRNPYWFEHVVKKNIRAWAEKLLPELVEQRKKQDERFARLPDELYQWMIDSLLQSQDEDPDYARQFMLFSLIARYSDENDRNKQMREKVIDCSWQLFEAPAEGPYFITTDNPGAAVELANNQKHSIKLDGGFALFFPLSHRYALVFTDQLKDNAFSKKHEHKEIYRVAANAEMVMFINDTLIQVANKLLIAATSDYLGDIADKNKPPEKG